MKKSNDEFAVNNLWELVKSDANLRSYLPADEMDFGRYPDRDFFWGIAFTVIPAWAKKYYEQVRVNRMN